MRSKLHLKGHPLHPILVGFPIAFFSATLLFDLIAWTNHNIVLWTTGMYLELAGIIMGLLAAIPGLVDYFSVVPPKSTARQRATRHGIFNVIMLTAFAITWFYRQNRDASPYIIITAEALAVIIMVISGWMGGTLVSRNQIGIDHRYAHAGKWKEKYFKTDAKEVEIGNSDALKTGQMMLIHVSGRRIVVGRTEDGYVAFDDRCPHRGGTLADGVLIGGVVQCPWHGSQFDCRSGAVKAGPAREGINTYRLREQEGRIFLSVS